MFLKTSFLNKNSYLSTLGFLQDSLYLGQFLAYFGPLYHFGIVKVCTLSTQIGKSIIIVLEMLWSKTFVSLLFTHPLYVCETNKFFALAQANEFFAVVKWGSYPLFSFTLLFTCKILKMVLPPSFSKSSNMSLALLNKKATVQWLSYFKSWRALTRLSFLNRIQTVRGV